MLSRRIFKKPSIKLQRCFAQIITAQEAAKLVKQGDTLLSGGFGICGNPNSLIKALANEGTGDITMVSNNAGLDHYGLGILLQRKQIRRAISSYVGENKEFERQYLNGELELEITPQGTLAEKIRSGGKGIPGFWTKTGANTLIETGGFPIKFATGSDEVEIYSEPKETRIYNGKDLFSDYFFLV